MSTYNVVYVAPELAGFELSKRDSERPIYKKELIYSGNFIKKTSNEALQFSVDNALLQHWLSTFQDMQANGVEVPLPLEHSRDPEKRRGTVVDMELGTNERGLPALFGYIQFRDDDAEKLALTSQTSIFVSPEMVDGIGHKYLSPIEHVALTDYPVIPKLGQFEVIAASLTSEDDNMGLRSLAEKMGVDMKSDDARDDVALEGAIMNVFNGLKSKLKELKKPDEAPIAASFLKLARDNRTMRLDSLVANGNITKAVRDKLEQKFCTDACISLALSSNDEAFDDLIATLSENDPVVLGEQTGAQTKLALSNVRNDSENPLLKDAVRRATEASK